MPRARPGPQRQPFSPGAEPDHLAAAGQQPGGRAGVVVAVRTAQVRPGDVHQPVGGQPERLLARARPPGEPDRRVQQPERGGQQRQRRITPGGDQGRPGRADGPDRLACPPAAGAGPGGQAAGRPESGRGRRRPPQRKRDVPGPHRRERDPGPGAARRRDRCRRDRRRRVARPEQVPHGHIQRLGQREGDPQRRVAHAGLDGGDGLPRYPGPAGYLLLGEPARPPGPPQPRPESVTHAAPPCQIRPRLPSSASRPAIAKPCVGLSLTRHGTSHSASDSSGPRCCGITAP